MSITFLIFGLVCLVVAIFDQAHSPVNQAYSPFEASIIFAIGLGWIALGVYIST